MTTNFSAHFVVTFSVISILQLRIANWPYHPRFGLAECARICIEFGTLASSTSDSLKLNGLDISSHLWLTKLAFEASKGGFGATGA